jgi:DNA gyrase subunit B
MSSATENVAVEVPAAKTEYRGQELVRKMHDLTEFRKLHGKLTRRIGDGRALECMVLELGMIENSEASWRAFLSSRNNLERVQALLADGSVESELTYDEEHSLFGLRLRNGSSGGFSLDYEFLCSAEWRQLAGLYHSVAEFRQGPLIVREGNAETTANDEGQLVDHVLGAGKKNLTIQRYKGLGEMNPQQLWETTMDPHTRTLLQVNIDDAIETDEIFTILMGDQVEPRRKFIEDNALNVRNLDI